MGRWLTRKKDGRHFQSRRGLYSAARYQKYANLVSIQTPSQAKSSVSVLLSEFNGAERAKKVRVKRAVVQAANRASVASKNMRLSLKERKEMAQVAEVYNEAKTKMVIPPKVPSLKAQQSDENMAGPDYRVKAVEFRAAGYPRAAQKLEFIASQEDNHEKILKAIRANPS